MIRRFLLAVVLTAGFTGVLYVAAQAFATEVTQNADDAGDKGKGKGKGKGELTPEL